MKLPQPRMDTNGHEWGGGHREIRQIREKGGGIFTEGNEVNEGGLPSCPNTMLGTRWNASLPRLMGSDGRLGRSENFTEGSEVGSRPRLSGTGLRTGARSGISHPVSIRAFTMIEIAIAIAVIGFALVAIVGVLPTGLNVQRDNRADTIINQEGPYFLNAIRNGSRGLDILTQYVDEIDIVTNYKGLSGTIEVDTTNTGPNKLVDGQTIVGLLSKLSRGPDVYPDLTNDVTTTVVAKVRALTGSALEQGGSNAFVAFKYQITSEVVPYN